MYDAIILTGGRGIRLGVLTESCPKPFLQVDGRPFVSRIVERLGDQGVKRVIFAAGYMSDVVEWYVDQNEKMYQNMFGDDFVMEVSTEKERKGTAGACKLAFDLVEADRAFVLNGDSFFLFDLQRVVECHEKEDFPVTISVTRKTLWLHGGAVFLGKGSCAVRKFDYKNSLYGGHLDAGLYLIDKHMVDGINGEYAIDFSTTMFPHWARGGRVGAVVFDSDLLDIGIRSDYVGAKRRLNEFGID